MLKRIGFVLVLCGVLAAQGNRPVYAPGHIVVQERAGDDPSAVAAAIAGVGGRVVRGVAAIHHHVVDVPEGQTAGAIERLLATGLFSVAERDGRAYVTGAPNDPSFPAQWHLAQIHVPAAWGITTGSSLPIAIIDSGADLAHPDLAARLAGGWNFLSGTSATQDGQGHGTAVGGVIGAITNNLAGVAGVTWNNPIMPLVVVDAAGYADYSNIAAAITYAADHGARIINISIGGTSSSSTLQNAVNYAWGKGAIIFAAAGNSASGAPLYPAGCTNVVAVAATDAANALASFSNYGSWIDLDAPGVNILTTTAGGGYGYWSGTSFSSPIAAGVGALVLAVQPSLSAPALVNLLEQNAGTIGSSSLFGYGLVDAARAVSAAQAMPSAPPGVAITAPAPGSTVTGTVTVTGLVTDSLGVSSVTLYCDGNLVASTSNAAFSIPWNTGSVTAGLHTLNVAAIDRAGNTGSASIQVTVPAVQRVPDTTPPSVQILSPANGSRIPNNGNLTINVAAQDNVGVVQVSMYADGVQISTGTSAPYSGHWNAKRVSAGAHVISATAWDAAGNHSTASITLYQ